MIRTSEAKPLDTGLVKLRFGFFHGLSEVEGRSELRMFNRLFFEAQLLHTSSHISGKVS